MGSLILCHKKRAKQPYMITRVHIRIYTIEELCYYTVSYTHLDVYKRQVHASSESLSDHGQRD